MSASPLFFIGVTVAFAASIAAALALEADAGAASPLSYRIVLVTAVVLRLLALPAAPALTDDIWRYLWDGRVQAHGINPYLHAPADPALDAIDAPFRDRINNPDLPTIYPPLTQAVFLAGALLPGGIVAMKLVMTLFDLGTILALAAILRRRGADPARVVLYAWSPLAVIEVAWSGHCDPVGVCLLMLATLGIIGARPRGSIVAAGLSAAAKYAGLLAAPSLLKRAGPRALWVLLAAILAVYLPYLGAGWRVLGSLPAYAERWRFNDSLFAGLLALVERTGLSGAVRAALRAGGALAPDARWETSLGLRLSEPLSIAKLLAAALFLLIAVRVLRAGWDDPLREIAAVIGAALILAPTLHPWYLLWVAPFLAVVPRLSWTWLTYAAPVCAYPMLAARAPDADPLGGLRWVEFTPFFVILAIETARRRLWERG